MYYVISLYNTEKWELYITLWQPGNAGYCFSKEMAGLYPEPREGYHNSDRNMIISQEKADELFVFTTYEGEQRHLIPNNKKTWEKLGVKFNSKTKMLERIVPYTPPSKQPI